MTVKDRKGKKNASSLWHARQITSEPFVANYWIERKQFTFPEGERAEPKGLADVQFAVTTSSRNRKAGFYKERTKYIEIVINYFY